MATKWTRDQASVIDHRGSNLLVAAAAGSGKTAVLIERIISLVTDKDRPIDIDKLLVVTFTKAAANEMRERVGLALEDILDKDPENEHLQKQVLLLNRADITTIDSFCGRVVRENFHASDLDPNVRTGDPAEIEMIKKDVIENLFEDLYDEKNGDFLSLVDLYSARNNDKPLVDLILKLNAFIDSSAYPEDWLDRAAERFNTSGKDDREIISSYLGPYLSNELSILASSTYRLEAVVEQLEDYDDLAKYRDFIGHHLAYLRPILGVLSPRLGQEKTDFDSDLDSGFLDLDLEALKNSIDIYNSGKAGIKAFRIGSKVDEYVKVDYKKIKKMVDDIFSDIRSILARLYIGLDEVRLELDMAYPYMRAISNITKLFRKSYRQKLKGLGLVDFSYIAHTALDILIDRSGESPKPSKIALAYRDMYEEVFIDEYQDSNMVQELILSTISRTSPGNRFMVGDVKQSIYRFRQAMPEIFMNKYEDYAISQGPLESGRKILLYNNFRSRAQVLEACNHVFMSIMRKATGELDYTQEERLNPSAIFKDLDYDSIDESAYRDLVGGPDKSEIIKQGPATERFNVGGPVELRLVDKNFNEDDQDLDGQALEEFRSTSSFRYQCQAIGAYIDQVVNNKERPYLVFDRKLDKYRRIEYRDIVVLFRSLKSRVEDIEDVFGQLGIPLYSDLGGDYFSTLEVSIFENLLRVIDNPRQDICLLSIMRSPIYKFEPSDFALLRLVDKDLDIYGLLDKLYEMDQAELDSLGKDYQDLRLRVVDFMDQIDAYRRMSVLMPLDEFIWFLLKDTGYYAYVGGLEMGQHRQNNLILFFERARSFEKTSFKGLFNFVNYIDRVKTRGSDMGEAKELSEDANVVRLMTIHKSKGLEFPLVIVAKADGKFNFRSSDHRLSLHQDMGFGPKIIDKVKRLSFPSMAKLYIDKKMELEQEAEEMRLLYVAMTRAKEKLVFFANIDDFSKQMDEWKSKARDLDGNVEDFEILKSRTYLDWIMMSIARLEARGKTLDARGQEYGYIGYRDTNWIIAVEDRLRVFKRAKDIESRLETLLPSQLVETKEEKSGPGHISVRPYHFQASALKPASISVSEVKKIIEAEDQTQYENMYMSRSIPDLKTPAFMHRSESKLSFSPGERGTIFHLVMELLDFEGLYTLRDDDRDLKDKLDADLEALVDKNILRPEELATVNRKWIADFVKTPIFERLSQAAGQGLLHRETAIDYNISLTEIYKDESIDETERIMLVGIVDVFFEDQDGDLVLIDYKTDYVSRDRYGAIVARYKPQLDLYARALEDISGKRVKEKYIYLFSVGDLVSYD